MQYALIVHSSGLHGQGARSALNFAEACLARGHEIMRVFFYHEGALAALADIVCPQEEEPTLPRWQKLAQNDGVELAVCIAAALRRGVLNESEAERYDRHHATIDANFEIVGLGQLAEAVNVADRVVTFAD